jgi:excisionase family DNA binding protein
MFDDYYNLLDAARVLGVHPQSLRRIIHANKIRAEKVFGAWLVNKKVLEDFKANYDPRPGRKPYKR